MYQYQYLYWSSIQNHAHLLIFIKNSNDAILHETICDISLVYVFPTNESNQSKGVVLQCTKISRGGTIARSYT